MEWYEHLAIIIAIVTFGYLVFFLYGMSGIFIAMFKGEADGLSAIGGIIYGFLIFIGVIIGCILYDHFGWMGVTYLFTTVGTVIGGYMLYYIIGDAYYDYKMKKLEKKEG